MLAIHRKRSFADNGSLAGLSFYGLRDEAGKKGAQARE
jgi:hypothetical protein